jgi:dihydrofolate reductase
MSRNRKRPIMTRIEGLFMARLIYSGIASLDGYIADGDGAFDWSAPDEEVHSFINDAERSVGTYLYGRRMYEVMAVWETVGTSVDSPAQEVLPYVQDFANIWRAADKVVYSRTLDSASSVRTRIQRDFDAESIRRMKSAAARDITVGGAHLAAQALAAGVVDECRLFLSPVAVGGGTPFFPHGLRLSLELLEERRFDNGVVYLRYRAGE